MRIGFDAKRAFHNNRGLGNYSRGLIWGLSQLQKDWELFLFSPSGGEHNNWMQGLENTRVINPNLPTFLSSFWRSFLLSNQVHENKIQIYHGLSHELPYGLNTKQVVTVHDLLWYKIPENFSFIDRKIYKSKLKSALDKCDLALAICEQTKQDLMEIMKVSEDKIRVHYQCCDPNICSPFVPTELERYKNELKLPDQFFLSVGAIEPNKNTLNVVKAFNSMSNNDEFKLILVGSGGPYFEEVKNYIKKNSLSSKILHFSYLNSDQLKALYQLASALVFPSFFEGFGLPIIESLWLNTPVVTTDNPSFKEAAGDGALFVDPHTVDDISKAMDLVIKKDPIVEETLRNGHEFVQRYHWKNTTQKLIDIYQGLCS